MRSTRTRLVVGALALVAIIGGPAARLEAQPTSIGKVVAIFADPTYVATTGCATSPPDSNCTEHTLAESIGAAPSATIRTITGISAADFTTGLDGANVLVIPELAVSNTLGADLSANARTVLTSWVESGGRVVFAGAGSIAADPTPTINTVFGFTTALLNSPSCTPLACVPTPEITGTEFEALTSLDNVDFMNGLALPTLPTLSIVPFEDPNNIGAPVAVLAYGTGSVVYVAWNFLDAAPAGSTTSDWATVMDLATTPMWVTIQATASGPADGTDVDCPITTGPGSQDVTIAWTGVFQSTGETFTGEQTLPPNGESGVVGFTTRPTGDTANVTISVLSPFGVIDNATCVVTFTSVAPPTTAAPATVTPAFTG